MSPREYLGHLLTGEILPCTPHTHPNVICFPTYGVPLGSFAVLEPYCC